MIELKPNSSVTGEIVPAQDPNILTIEGIPQEVIDEIYDIFDEVDYSKYMVFSYLKNSKKDPTIYVADYYEVTNIGDFSYLNAYNYKMETARGDSLKRYMVFGIPSEHESLLTLTSVQEYNCIRTKS